MQTETAPAFNNNAFPVLVHHRILLTVRQFAEKHPAFSQGSLRNLIFMAETRHTSKGRISGNGLDVALVRVGRKLLIDESRFFEWIDSQQKVEA